MKPTNIEVKGLPIFRILGKSEDKLEQFYDVPKYQREYIWSKKEWEALFDDILENSQGYFLGSIITIKQKNKNKKIVKYEIIDGQQRLTTISLLILAIYNKLQESVNGLNPDQLELIAKLKRSLLPKNFEDVTRLKLQSQGNNLNDYLLLLHDYNLYKKEIKSPYARNRRIYKAFEYFTSRIEEILESQEPMNDLFEFINKLRKSMLVFITVYSQSDAYILFESLNNRGRPLTPIDLIKNQFLSKISSMNYSLDEYFEKWKKVIGNLGDEYSIQERFFRQNFNAFRNILSRDNDIEFNKSLATKTNLIDKYNGLIDRNPKSFINEILENSKIYSGIILNNDDFIDVYQSDEIKKALINLQRIGGAPSYILLLYLIKRKETLDLPVYELQKIINLLISFFVRRNLTDKPATRNLTRLFMEQINYIENNQCSSIEIYNYIKNDIIKASATDSEYKDKLHGQIFIENDGVTRFILCSISEFHEEKVSNSEKPPRDFWSRNSKNNNYIWTIEHIFPQGVNIPDYWIKMIADGDKEKAKEYQEQYLHTLGNLTLSGYNSSLSNASFKEKRDKKDGKGNFIGYKNGIYLNQQLCEFDEWTIQKIQERTHLLANEAMEIFKL